MTRLQALADIALALALTLIGGIFATAAGFFLIDAMDLPLLLVLAMQGLVILIGLPLLLRARGQRWRQLRLLPLRGRDWPRALLSLGLVFLASIAFNLLVSRAFPTLVEAHQAQLTALAATLTGGLPVVAVAAVMLFVGFYEELLARGFLLSRCQSLVGGNWGPALLSSALFGLGHVYQGWVGVVQTAVVGLVFAGVTLRWGTLWPAILAHAALDTFSLVALRAMG